MLQAGDLNIGAFDDFATLIPLAKKYGAWVHIDGAFGLWAAASDKYRHLLAGAEMADSWTTDGHKWLNVPYDCGYAFVADAEAHRATMSQRSSYIPQDGEGRDQDRLDTGVLARRAAGICDVCGAAATRAWWCGGACGVVLPPRRGACNAYWGLARSGDAVARFCARQPGGWCGFSTRRRVRVMQSTMPIRIA